MTDQLFGGAERAGAAEPIEEFDIRLGARAMRDAAEIRVELRSRGAFWDGRSLAQPDELRQRFDGRRHEAEIDSGAGVDDRDRVIRQLGEANRGCGQGRVAEAREGLDDLEAGIFADTSALEWCALKWENLRT